MFALTAVFYGQVKDGFLGCLVDGISVRSLEQQGIDDVHLARATTDQDFRWHGSEECNWV